MGCLYHKYLNLGLFQPPPNELVHCTQEGKIVIDWVLLHHYLLGERGGPLKELMNNYGNKPLFQHFSQYHSLALISKQYTTALF